MAQKRRRLRSGTVILGGMGILATALTSCGSEPDKRCVDRNSYEAGKGYRVLDSKACKSSGSGSSSGTWYYGSSNSSGRADKGTFDKSKAVSRGGFGCSSSKSHSGSSGG
ncbi:hypothetical protein [Streptomyces sp. NPDC049555]|uniref:hypothetical protein n=1 Tax=unclassified Streptomyces TaxID=2593676 RepID=UPI00344077DB